MTNYITRYLVDLNDLKIIERISSGAFGTVYLVQDKKTNIKYAAKMIHSEAEQSKLQINREIGIMLRMQHPTIIKLYGYSLTDFEGKNHVTLILQFAKNGSLANLLKNVRNGLADHLYDNTTRQKILVGIARGMMYLHKHNVIHRDLKPANILLNNDLEPYITDFGASKFYSLGQSNNQTQSVGTSIYMAPEVIEGKKYNGKADVYSFAILMFEVVTDIIPYEEFQKGKMSLFQFNMKVVSENYRPQFKEPIKESIRSLIEQCWSKDPNNRPTFEEIFNRLAFNIEESVYDVFENNDEAPRYYLDGVDQDDLLFYVDEINVDAVPSASTTLSSPPSFSSAQFDELKEKVASLEFENKRLADEQTKLTDLVQQQSNEIKHLRAIIDKKKDKSDSDSESEPKPVSPMFIKKTASGKVKASKKKDKSDSDSESEPKTVSPMFRKKTASRATIDIPYRENKELEGIITYLKNNSKNISDEITITASSIMKKTKFLNVLSNLIQYRNKDLRFSTEIQMNSWICFEFKSRRVNLTNYTIRSKNSEANCLHPKTWVIQGSNDNSNWELIDEQKNCDVLNGPSIIHTFKVSNPSNKEYKFLRMLMTGDCWCKRYIRNRSDCIVSINSIEFYGKLLSES